MILIYNLMGLLVGLAGVAAGFPGHLLYSGGCRSASSCWRGVWFAFGGRRRDKVTGAKKPYPSLFFIPLRWASVVPLVLSVGMIFLEAKIDNLPPDPRKEQLEVVEKQLRQNTVSGEKQEAEALLGEIRMIAVEEAGADEYHLAVHRREGAVLVLMRAENLGDFADSARTEMLDFLVDRYSFEPELYIGIRGRFAYGAMLTPAEGREYGKFVSDRPLLAFFGDPPPANLPAEDT